MCGGKGGGSRGMGSSCVFKLSFEVKQGSCLLHLLRKIYLYLQYDASNTARAQVTVMWVQNEGMRVGTRVRNELQRTSSVLQLQRLISRHTTSCASVFLYVKHKPVGYKYTAIHPVGGLRFILDIGMLSPFISLCYSFVTILLFQFVKASTTGKLQLNSKLLLVLHHVLLLVPLLVLQVFILFFSLFYYCVLLHPSFFFYK